MQHDSANRSCLLSGVKGGWDALPTTQCICLQHFAIAGNRPAATALMPAIDVDVVSHVRVPNAREAAKLLHDTPTHHFELWFLQGALVVSMPQKYDHVPTAGRVLAVFCKTYSLKPALCQLYAAGKLLADSQVVIRAAAASLSRLHVSFSACSFAPAHFSITYTDWCHLPGSEQ